MAENIKFDVIGLKKYVYPFLFFFLASSYLLMADSAWDSLDVGFMLLICLYSVFRQPNPWGPVTISDTKIKTGKGEIALDVIDWENADLDIDKIHLYPVGKSWADGVKINMKHYEEGLRSKLNELQSSNFPDEE